MDAYRSFKAAKAEYDKALKDSFKASDDFQDLANYASGEKSKLQWDEKTGSLRKGAKTFENVRSSLDAQKAAEDMLTQGDPALVKAYADVRGGYGNYKVAEKIFNDPRTFNFKLGELVPAHIDTKLQQMRGNFEPRMLPGDFEELQKTVRQNAPLKKGVGTESPGVMERGGNFPVSGRGHMGGMSAWMHLPSMGRGSPLFTKFIGDQAPLPAHSIPALITKGLASKTAKAASEPLSASVVEMLNKPTEEEGQ